MTTERKGQVMSGFAIGDRVVHKVFAGDPDAGLGTITAVTDSVDDVYPEGTEFAGFNQDRRQAFRTVYPDGHGYRVQWDSGPTVWDDDWYTSTDLVKPSGETEGTTI